MLAMKSRMSAHSPGTDRPVDAVEDRPGADDLCGEAWLDTLFDPTQHDDADGGVVPRTMP